MSTEASRLHYDAQRAEDAQGGIYCRYINTQLMLHDINTHEVPDAS